MRKKLYEICFLLKSDMSEEDVQKEVAFIENTLLTNGGESVTKELWGTKHLAYPIEKKTDAMYYLFYLKATPGIMALIDPLIKRRENILRYLLVEIKKLPEVEQTDKGDTTDGGTKPE